MALGTDAYLKSDTAYDALSHELDPDAGPHTGSLPWSKLDLTTSDIADLTTKSHTSLSDKGTNAHSVIDIHLANTSNPHSVTAAQASAIADAINTVDDTHIDWGTGANQVSADDVPDGSTYAIITLTQETNFETGFTHSQDNTQAHSDYLKNNANDSGVSLVLTDDTNVPLVLNNSTGSQNIFVAQQNGTDRFYIDDDGVVSIRPKDTTSQISALSIIYEVNQNASHQGIENIVKQIASITGSSRTIQGGNYVVQGKNTGQSSLTLIGSASTVSQQVTGTLPLASSMKAGINIASSVAGTITNANLFETALLARDGTITNARGLYVPNFQKDTGSINVGASVWLDKQTVAGTNYGIVLNGDGIGSDIIFGSAHDAKIDYDGTNMRLQPHIVGTGHLDIVGTYGTEVETVASDTTLDETHSTVLVDASGDNRIITLPAISGRTGRIYTVKKIDSSGNTVTVDGNSSETIDGSTTKVLSGQYDAIHIQNDGSEWWIL